jgi:hypothetical protein
MMPGLEQARGGYPKYTASHGAADVDSALVLNTIDHLDLLVACDAAVLRPKLEFILTPRSMQRRVPASPAMASRTETAARTFGRLRRVDARERPPQHRVKSFQLPTELARWPNGSER